MSDKSRLQNLRTPLHRLHGALLEALRYRLQKATDAPVAAGHWLMLLSNDAAYAWVRPFTQLLTEVDILLDEETLPSDSAAEIRRKTEALFKADQEPFGRKFFEMMPLETEVLFSYHPFLEALRRL